MNTRLEERPSRDEKTERRKNDRPRRRLVDLTLKAGTDRRRSKGRRKEDQLDVKTSADS